ncbi:hypothetical protein DYB32_000208 [Aphanomyces invadans]|uniref:Thioredoxin domain-containing protein n=1 Tax=Aphanomyces invadans TaxID=157072 RepID=A0A418BAN5_9STRA|nr:hypothetical protein DYB32_000208 [Aphanomyces invadans]
MKMFMKNRMWRDHWQVIAGASVVVVALFCWSFLQAANSTNSIHFIHLGNREDIDRVFRSGEPWLVLCSKPDAILPDVFDKASKRLVGKAVHVGVVDCHDKLPSGKSVFKKFLLRDDISPTVFTIANGEKPKQVHPFHHLQKQLHEVQNTKQLEDKCLGKTATACVLIHRNGKQKFDEYQKQWIQALMHEHRLVKFVWMDASILKLSVDSLFKKPITDSSHHRLVLFKRATKARDDITSPASWSAKAYTSYFDKLPVQTFLNEHAIGDVSSDSFRLLTKEVTVKRRPKKQPATQTPQEIAERERRERMDEASKEHFPQGVDENELQEDLPSSDRAIHEDIEVLDLDEL